MLQWVAMSPIRYPFTITVGSCKGGVGKSTCATLCALALSKMYKVGLLDADIYGPSVLDILGYRGVQSKKLHPITIGPITCLSIAPARKNNDALVWRAPILHKTLLSLMTPELWQHVDLLIIDLPPGTGDIPLTIAQNTPLLGHITVTTPHHLSVQESLVFQDFCHKLSINHIGTIINMHNLYTPSPLLPQLMRISPHIATIDHTRTISDCVGSPAILHQYATLVPQLITPLRTRISHHIKHTGVPH